VIGKAEILSQGENPRFIVTNLPKDGWATRAQAARFEAAALYEKFYCARGDMENRIKEQQMDLFADRTSTHWLASNQLRLWFSAFAHLIMSTLQAEVLKGTALEPASIGQICACYASYFVIYWGPLGAPALSLLSTSSQRDTGLHTPQS
jgi:hypothetical protein